MKRKFRYHDQSDDDDDTPDISRRKKDEENKSIYEGDSPDVSGMRID